MVCSAFWHAEPERDGVIKLVINHQADGKMFSVHNQTLWRRGRIGFCIRWWLAGIG